MSNYKPCGCPLPRLTREYDRDRSMRHQLARFIHHLFHVKDEATIEAMARHVMLKHKDLFQKLED